MIRLGIIGCGEMAGNFVARCREFEGRMHLTAAVDRNVEKAQAVAAALGTVKSATDYRQVLDDVDAVLIALPHHMHHPVGIDCLRAGKHVLVEKPLANTEPQCLEMIEAAGAANRVLMVGYIMRFHPLIVKLKELVDSGEFGRCFQMSVWTEQYTHYPPGHWANNLNELGGGQLFSHGCHYVDMLLWFMGRPVSGTHVGTKFGTEWVPREGTSHIAMKFESGALGYHFGTWGARGTELGYSFHCHCERGLLSANLRRGAVIFHQFKLGPQVIEPHIDNSTVEGKYGTETVLLEASAAKPADAELNHFLSCIENRCRPLVDGARSLESLRAIWRLYDAEEKGVVADLRGIGLD